MSERLTIRLWEPVSAWQALKEQAWPYMKAMLIAGHRLILEIRLENRSDKQNRLLHSRFGDIAKHIEWCGCKRDTDTWKRLLTAAWLRARGESIELLPAIDGHGVDVVFRHTSKLTRAECVELSEYIFAWGSEREVPWCLASLGRELAELEESERKAKRERIAQDTGEITEMTS